jgi:hypothetical protein
MFKVHVITPAYFLSGEAEENSAFLGWLNNKDKNAFDIFRAEGLVLDPSTALPATAAAHITLDKGQVVGIIMANAEGQRSIKVGDRAERAVLYTARFVIQAHLHPTGDMGINRIPDVIKSNFVAATKASLYPLLPTRQLPTLEAEVILLNWRHIDFYHAR